MARKLPRNLRAYGLMEAFNVLLVPGFALVVATPRVPLEMAIMALAILACGGFLVVGARYWLALDAKLKGKGRERLARALRFADRAERPLLMASGAAVLAVAGGFALVGFTAPIVAGALLTALAWLEYVNYYHRQLQNFDKASDLARLFGSGRLRRAHMARDLAAWRARGKA